MIRFMNLNTAFLALTLLVAYGTYHVKYDAQRSLKQIRTLDRQIEEEREREKVLAADWGVLNEPTRLQRLAVRHLALVPVEAKQISTVAELKERVPVLTASAQDNATPGGIEAGLIRQASAESRPVIIRR